MSKTQLAEVYQSLHNPKNILVNLDDIKQILFKCGMEEYMKKHRISLKNWDLELFRRAFTHISYSSHRQKRFPKTAKVIEREEPGINPEECVQVREDSMERLEWLGDGVLQSVVAVYLWKRFPGQDEGFYTKTRSKLVKTEAFGKFGEYLGLHKYILVSYYAEHYNNARLSLKNMEDCFEAFIGALFLQTEDRFQYSFVKELVIRIIEKVVDLPMLILIDHNYKDQLTHYFNKRFDGKKVTYEEVSAVETYEEQNGFKVKKNIYTMEVKDSNGKQIGVGISSKSKQEAQQNAAKEACRLFGLPVFDRINPFLV